MVEVRLADGEVVDSYPTLGEGIAQMRDWWMEAPENDTVFTALSEGVTLAVLLRDQTDPEVCHTLYADGTVEHHRCRYVTEEGKLHSVVTELGVSV